MRRVPLLVVCSALALPLVLTGCDKGETAPATTAPSASAATAADPAAEAFVRSLYSTANGGTSTAADGVDIYDGPLWSARTAALIHETTTLTPEGDEGFFEANPLCACQDDGGMQLTRVTVTPKDADHADAAVVMTWTQAQPPSTIHQTYNLVRENGAWKIDDIQRDQTQEFAEKPLVESLNAWIADARAHPST